MAPEQLRGERVDERADIFALGVMVFEALAGQRPFQGRTPLELLRSMEEPVSAIHRVPEPLAAILQKCMQKDPGGRFGSVAELQRALIPALLCCPPEAACEKETQFME
jgi:serine/threonine-protein kinase